MPSPPNYIMSFIQAIAATINGGALALVYISLGSKCEDAVYLAVIIIVLLDTQFVTLL